MAAFSTPRASSAPTPRMWWAVRTTTKKNRRRGIFIYLFLAELCTHWDNLNIYYDLYASFDSLAVYCVCLTVWKNTFIKKYFYWLEGGGRGLIFVMLSLNEGVERAVVIMEPSRNSSLLTLMMAAEVWINGVLDVYSSIYSFQFALRCMV